MNVRLNNEELEELIHFKYHVFIVTVDRGVKKV